ncbi:MAG TPA: heterodisulfide reductase-related iron-sulfur binding cluster [Dehalococcoidia bacterium]|nr:heterodisulfide reductase-related iron-sulfur binding cluster [Dehalococcoidia bacterium]
MHIADAPEASHEHVPTLEEDIARCVHCGFCLQACPTYVQLGAETDSPRGRIALIDALASGRAEATPSLVRHLDLCLQCRACETACPSGVQFGRIMERGRAQVMEGERRPAAWGLRASMLRQLLPHPGRLSFVMSTLRAYQRSPLPGLLRRSGVLAALPAALRSGEASLPDLPAHGFVPPTQPAGLTRSVAMLTGCVMPHLYPRTHEATMRVLNALGYRVVLPEGETCCGALSLHAGDRRFARELARRNIGAFLAAGVEAVVVNAAGCGSAMKEYAELLDDDPAYREKAARMASLTRDVLEFVAEQALPALGRVERTVTYQDSCHLVHAQKVKAAPRAILRAIPGLELVEMAAPDRCCGSAGIYSIVEGTMSARVLADKMDDVQATGAGVVATANPGCMMQLEGGMRQRGIDGEVVHVIELLDEAIRAGREVQPATGAR